jgi:taspase (threonine aspartase 1)
MEDALVAARAALLAGGGDALSACVAAVASMEDNPSCNAGFGSNLTEDGRVECDASVMDGNFRSYGACGAVPGVRNPVCLAARLLQRQRGPRRPYGRVHPMILVGEGARSWANAEGVHVDMGDEALVSDEVKRRWERLVAQLHEEEAAASGARGSKRKRLSSDGVDSSMGDSVLHDTVGAVVCDGGHVASAVSSGGIWLKHSGRVGEAAIYGAGCWAEDGSTAGSASTAASVSGVGEQIIARMLAQQACVMLAQAADGSCEKRARDLVRSSSKDPDGGARRATDGPDAGIVAVRCVEGGQHDCIEWMVAHSAPSFAVGYLTSSSEDPTTFISRNRSLSMPNDPVVIFGSVPRRGQEQEGGASRG